MLGKINTRLDNFEQEVYTYKFKRHHLIPVIAPILILFLMLPIVMLGVKSHTNTFSNAQGTQSVEAASAKPNIVIFLLDDYEMIGDNFLSQFPNIKSQFVDSGVSFQNYYGNDPLCCPGRATILTGEYAHNHGVVRNDAKLFDPRETIATELKEQGYYTFMSGKYFNGTQLLADKSPVGWDQVAIMSGGYYNYDSWVNDVLQHHGGTASDYSTDFFGGKALDFLKSAPSDKPVFAYITPYGVHAGEDPNGKKDHTQPVPPQKYLNDSRCTNAPRLKQANFNESDISDKPAWVKKLPSLDSYYTGGFPMVKTCRTLLSVDDEIGSVINELKAEGRYQNTIFVLTADNGMGWGSHRWLNKIAPYTTQVPLFISWPAGRGNLPLKNSDLYTSVDLAPTLCEFAGCVMGPYPNGKKTADGISFANIIASVPTLSPTSTLTPSPSSASAAKTTVKKKKTLAATSRNAIITEHAGSAKIPKWRSVRTSQSYSLGQWHYIRYRTGEKELYDVSGGPCFSWSTGMAGDPCELKNLAGISQYASTVAQLNTLMDSMWVSAAAKVDASSLPATAAQLSEDDND